MRCFPPEFYTSTDAPFAQPCFVDESFAGIIYCFKQTRLTK